MPYSPSPVTTVGQGTSSATSGSKFLSTVETKTKQENSFVHRLSKISFLSHIKNNLQADFNKSSTSDRLKAKNGKFPPVDEEDPDSKNGEHSLILKGGKDGTKDEKKALINIKDAKAERPKWKVATEKVINGWYFQIFMMVITIYCLFGDDFRQAVFPMGADPYFYTLTSASLILFTVEIIVSSIVIEGYWLGFFFWLDVIATVSLIFDIGWIMNLILGVSATGGGSTGSNV